MVRIRRRSRLLLLAAVPVLVLLLVGAGLVWTVGEDVVACPERVAADEAKVRTDRQWVDENVPGLGDHRGVHWQADALGNPCSRVPGPTDWRYQGVVALRPADARALTSAYSWGPAPAGEPAVWPGLAPHVPAGTSWRHRLESEEDPAGTRNVQLYLDPDRAVVLFEFWNS